ncbi:MAG: tRNA (guanosine(46)-N7)-methyltransferase TrmB [Acholeplasmatales bacterium]
MKSSPLVVNEKKKLIKSNLYLELGAGKGDFIYKLAEANPNNYYVAVEKQSDIIYRILQKQEEHTLDNLSLLNMDVIEILDYFLPHTINTIYINFPDPWHKVRHHKRRLTYPSFLKMYKLLLIDCGKILIRTDHKDFFNDSLGYLESESFKVTYSENAKEIFNMSEYEMKKRPYGQIYSIEASL